MKQLTESQVSNFKNFLNSHDFFFIVGHKEPDGDAVYSCLSMAELLKKQEKEYQLLIQGPFKRPEVRIHEKAFKSSIIFLSDAERKKTGLLMLDCSEYKRIGDLADDLKGLDIFIIDHHKTSEFDEEKCIIDSTSPATCSIVQLLYEKVVGPLDAKTAKYIFNGLSTDTGFFRFLEPSNADVFEMAARLVRAGANPRETYDFITGGKPFSTRKLLGKMLDRVELHFNGKLCVTYETMEDTRMFGMDGRDSDLLYSSLLSVEGVEAVLFLRQDTENSCTAGLRSRNEIDVSAIAAKFGGGGHKNAAGLSCDGKIENILPKIIQEFKAAMI